MRKIFLLSFDDGTIYDKQFVDLLNRHHIPCTFNLNSGLEEFVWEFEGKPVRRQVLADTVEQYRDHEIASHSLHHHLLTSLDEQTLRHEVGKDCENLRQIFGLEELGFRVFAGDHQSGTVSFVPDGDCEEAAEHFAHHGIALRAGLHCAPLAHRSAGTLQTGTVRVSFGMDACADQTGAFLLAARKLSEKC